MAIHRMDPIGVITAGQHGLGGMPWDVQGPSAWQALADNSDNSYIEATPPYRVTALAISTPPEGGVRARIVVRGSMTTDAPNYIVGVQTRAAVGGATDTAFGMGFNWLGPTGITQVAGNWNTNPAWFAADEHWLIMWAPSGTSQPVGTARIMKAWVEVEVPDDELNLSLRFEGLALSGYETQWSHHSKSGPVVVTGGDGSPGGEGTLASQRGEVLQYRKPLPRTLQAGGLSVLAPPQPPEPPPPPDELGQAHTTDALLEAE